MCRGACQMRPASGLVPALRRVFWVSAMRDVPTVTVPFLSTLLIACVGAGPILVLLALGSAVLLEVVLACRSFAYVDGSTLVFSNGVRTFTAPIPVRSSMRSYRWNSRSATLLHVRIGKKWIPVVASCAVPDSESAPLLKAISRRSGRH